MTNLKKNNLFYNKNINRKVFKMIKKDIDEILNNQIRKFLKQVGINSHRKINENFILANSSVRKRNTLVLHKSGDYLNKVYNFMLKDSYMHPHLHPGKEKIEKIEIVEGKIAIFFFNDNGDIKNIDKLSEGQSVFVPSFTWHTYIMLTDKVITYEKMNGIYDPKTWKELANWAPEENSEDSTVYLNNLYKE